MEASSPTSRTNLSILLTNGYIRGFSKVLMKDHSVPDDVMDICWKFYFIPFASAIITKDKDLNDFLELISEKISVKRMENAKLLYKGTRDASKDATFPYETFTDKGPYLFIIESTDGYVFGGYTAVNIVESEKKVYLGDNMAFVWILKGANIQKPIIYSIKLDGKAAVYHGMPTYWWIFGPSGADIVLYKRLADYHYCCVNDASGSQLRYNIPAGKTLLGSNSRHEFQMSELEIFSVPK